MKKVREWLSNKLSSILTYVKKRAPKRISGDTSGSGLFVGWLVPVVFIGFALGSALFGRLDWTFLWVGFATLYIRLFLREVREPDQANIF